MTVVKRRNTILRGDADKLAIEVEGQRIECHRGQSVAEALLAAGIYTLRNSPNAGTPRGAFCLMGVCQECAIRIDGHVRRACQTPVRAGMIIALRGAV